MAVSKRLRYEILRRDNHTCRYCGGVAPDVTLTVDHVVPTALGGSDDPSNLVAACKDCNAGKTSNHPDAPLVADVADRAVQWGAALERWAHLRGLRREERDQYVEMFDYDWRVWKWGPEENRQEIPRPADWKPTIWQFFELGLPYEELEDAITIACGNERVRVDETWRYFCGVIWKKVTKMQDEARALLEQEVDEEPQDLTEPRWESEEYYAGGKFVWDRLRYCDLAHELLAAHIDGRKAHLSEEMQWVA